MTDAAHQTFGWSIHLNSRCGLWSAIRPSRLLAFAKVGSTSVLVLAPVRYLGERSGERPEKLRGDSSHRLVGSWILSDRYRGHRDGDKTVDQFWLGKAEGAGRDDSIMWQGAWHPVFAGSNTARSLCSMLIDPTRRMVDPEEIANVHCVPPLSDQEQRCLDDWPWIAIAMGSSV